MLNAVDPFVLGNVGRVERAIEPRRGAVARFMLLQPQEGCNDRRPVVRLRKDGGGRTALTKFAKRSCVIESEYLSTNGSVMQSTMSRIAGAQSKPNLGSTKYPV